MACLNRPRTRRRSRPRSDSAKKVLSLDFSKQRARDSVSSAALRLEQP
jgi:hypothetical protein